MVIKNKYKDSLSEIYNEDQWMFSFLSADNTQVCHTFARCRDYLHDIVRTNLGGHICHIYGMVVSMENNPPIHLDAVKLVMYHNDTYKFNNFLNILPLLHRYEDIMGIYHTVIEPVYVREDGKKKFNAWLVSGDKHWMKSPQLLSLYTLLLRLADRWSDVMFTDIFQAKELLKKWWNSSDIDPDDEDDNSFDYLTSIIEVVKDSDHFDLFLKESKQIFDFDNYPLDVPISNFHNYYGIVSFFKTTSLNLESQVKAKELGVL